MVMKTGTHNASGDPYSGWEPILGTSSGTFLATTDVGLRTYGWQSSRVPTKAE